MTHTRVADRKATKKEVAKHRDAIRQLAHDLGLTAVQLRNDGALVVHSPESGYRAAIRLSAAASDRVGWYVHVITDDVPGATGADDL